MAKLLSDIKESDDFAYPAHVSVATVEWGNCSTQATALQWWKAGVHASSQDRQNILASGLTRDL